MLVSRLKSCPWVGLLLVLMVWVGGMSSSQADNSLFGELSSADHDFLRFRPTQWINLSVAMEEEIPGAESTVSGSKVGSLTVLPSIMVQWPNLRVRPYLDAGVGLNIGGLTSGTSGILLPLRFEEKLLLQVGGGITYDLGKGFSLSSSTTFSREKTTELLSHFSTPLFPLAQDDLEVNSYTVELGIRLIY